MDTYTGHLMSLPTAAGDLIAHLGREREVDAAFTLARPLLAIVPADNAATSSVRGSATSRIRLWNYGQILEKAWPALLEADHKSAFRFLIDRLADVVDIAFADDNEDLTSIWRPAVEDDAQNVGDSLLDTLVDAIRDHALDMAKTPQGLVSTLAVLAERPGPLFVRIGLHLVREHGGADDVHVALADRTLVLDEAVWHEYGELLRARYADLTAPQRTAILDLIKDGPGLELTPARAANGVTEADLVRRAQYWRLKRYSLISAFLDGTAKDDYEGLRDELGEPEHPTFNSYTSSWTGPTSPFSSDELHALGPRGVASTLQQWRSTGGSEDPSPEGLSRVLATVVTSEAAGFASAAREFAGLDATYVRSVLSGLATAVKDGVTFQWDPVLDLCEWAVAQPRSDDDKGRDWDSDPHWGWARRQVAELLSHGFSESSAQIPITERVRVWNLLDVLSDDPDPTPESERRLGGDNMDPATFSINTVRGESLHTVVRYAFWVERSLHEKGRFDGIRSIPEVEALLDRRLDLDIDSSLAIRSVYGRWFAQFVRMDAHWARVLAPRIFPSSPDLGAYFEAAWSAYITFTPAWNDVFEVLRDAYRLAIDRLAEESGRSAFGGDPRERLGDHLFAYRVIGLDSDDLFGLFWRTSTPAQQEHVIRRAGWTLSHKSTKTPAPDVLKRIAQTWEWVLEHSSTGEREPLASFGAWLGAPSLDSRWLLTQARQVLDLGVYLEPDFTVYEALPRLASDHPGEVVEVLRLMVMTDPEGWSLHGSTDEVREALSTILATNDSDVRAQAEALVHLLGARGMTMFRDLVSPD